MDRRPIDRDFLSAWMQADILPIPPKQAGKRSRKSHDAYRLAVREREIHFYHSLRMRGLRL